MKVYVNPEQFQSIVALCGEWDGNARWLPNLDRYLWDNDIRPNETASPEWPSGYRFLAGGVDHIDVTRRSVTIHDRCMNGVDGTTQFVRIKK